MLEVQFQPSKVSLNEYCVYPSIYLSVCKYIHIGLSPYLSLLWEHVFYVRLGLCSFFFFFFAQPQDISYENPYKLEILPNMCDTDFLLTTPTPNTYEILHLKIFFDEHAHTQAFK